MSIPQYQDFMRPALNALKDGKEKHIKEIEKIVFPIFNISDEECAKLLPCGSEPIVRNRMRWALYYMYRAGLVTKVRAIYKITKLGQEALSSGKKINVAFLEQFSSFQEFKNVSHTEDKSKNATVSEEKEIDPATRINNAIEEFNNKTKQELLEQLKNVDPIYFERICLDLMKAMGYGEKVSLTPKSHDGGIDGIINEDALGLDKIYLQAKRYSDNKVNEKEIQNFIGALSVSPVSKGVFITTSYFSERAKEKAFRVLGKTIKLIDGNEMVKLMLDYNIGVRVKETYQIKELDENYFSEEE